MFTVLPVVSDVAWSKPETVPVQLAYKSDVSGLHTPDKGSHFTINPMLNTEGTHN